MEPRCSKNEHVVGLFAYHALTTNNNEKSSWIVDSGKAPDQYGEWVHIAHRLDDPLTVKEALSSPEKGEWKKAMESEINSLNTNKVWDLAELPCGRKAI